MEEIFNNLDKKTKIAELRKQGLTYEKIAEQVGVSKQYISQILLNNCQVSSQVDVLKSQVDVLKSQVNPNNCQVSSQVDYTKQDLKKAFGLIKADMCLINRAVGDLQTTIIQLTEKHENLKNEMSEEFNKRVGGVIKHALNNAVDTLKRQIVAELKGGAK